jgi:type IX secretion system substrate protein
LFSLSVIFAALRAFMKYLHLLFVIFFFPLAAFAVAPITGTSIVCQSSTTALTNATTGGAWSSSVTTIAMVDTAGIVTGVAAGTSAITYTVGGSYVTATVTVNPTPALTSTLTPGPLCDSAIFNYTPTCSLPDTNFDWTRAFTAGIEDPAGSGNGNPDEQLINTTYVQVLVPYVYTLTVGGCTSTTTVSVIVNPTPSLSSPLAGHVCSGTAFAYAPSFHTPGTIFNWARWSVTGITPATSSGTGNISETLTNATALPITVAYAFRLTANGCSNTGAEIVLVDVSPCNAGVQQVSAPEGNIYPNPSRGIFTVYFPSQNNEAVALVITNVVGERVQELAIGTNTHADINLHVPPGVYFLSAVGEHERYYGKVVVER